MSLHFFFFFNFNFIYLFIFLLRENLIYCGDESEGFFWNISQGHIGDNSKDKNVYLQIFLISQGKTAQFRPFELDHS